MAFAGGTGIETDPYLVSTAEQLNDVRNYLTSYFLQTADIDLSSYTNWLPIGIDAMYQQFSGSYNGQNYRITGMYIKAISNSQGLFGSSIGLITNVNIDGIIDIETNTTYQYFYGMLAGTSTNSDIINCHSSGTINIKATVETQYIGGLVGFITQDNDTQTSLTKNCSSSVNIIDYTMKSINVGGFAGGIQYPDTYIISCCATGNTGGYINVGGFVGRIVNAKHCNDCFATGNVSASAGGGGFSGSIMGSFIEKCYWKGEEVYVSNTRNMYGAGGFTGNISEGTYENSVIKNCYAIGHLNSAFNRGLSNGFSGYTRDNNQTITDCYCVVTFPSESGGQYRAFCDNYNGNWSPTLNDVIVCNNCYFDSSINGGTLDLRAVSKTTAEMKIQSTFVNWDFTTPIWYISSANDGYPCFITVSKPIKNAFYYYDELGNKTRVRNTKIFSGNEGNTINYDWLNSPTTWHKPSTTISGDLTIAKKSNGKLICVITQQLGVFYEGECESLDNLVSLDDSVVNWTQITGLTQIGGGHCSVSRVGNELFLNVTDKAINGADATSILYKSPSGNGGDWEYFSTVHSVYRYEDGDWGSLGINASGCITELSSGRWCIVTAFYINYWPTAGNIFYMNYGFYTSDDKGLTWTLKRTFGAGMIWHDYYSQGTPKHIVEVNGNLYLAYGDSSSGIDIRFFKSSDNGENWEQTWSENVFRWINGNYAVNYELFDNGNNGLYLYCDSDGIMARIYDIADPFNSPSTKTIVKDIPLTYSGFTNPTMQILDNKLILTSSNNVLSVDYAKLNKIKNLKYKDINSNWNGVTL